jgi:hypothetical protein
MRRIPRRYETGTRIPELHGDRQGILSQMDMTTMRRVATLKMASLNLRSFYFTTEAVKRIESKEDTT